MGTASLVGRALRRRLMNIGLEYSNAQAIAHRVDLQIKSQGPEGAAVYLKKVGDALLNHLHGSPARPDWVKTRNGFPSFLDGCQDLPHATLLRLSKLARVIRLSEVSRRQVDKVKTAVVGPYKGSLDGLAAMTRYIIQGLAFYGFNSPERDVPKVGTPRPIGKFFSKVDSVSGPTEVLPRPDLVTPVRILRNVPELRGLPEWRKLFYPVSDVSLRTLFHPDKCRDRGHAVGEIHAAQEGGAKLRMFASPYTAVQELLAPIHEWIVDNFNRSVPTICTYDQKSGADWARSKLEQGMTLYSWDLSTATCRFPLDPQLTMLSVVGLPTPYLQALRWACEGSWKVGHELVSHFGCREISWRVGQPLGIKPSMSMFTLAHAMLLTGITRDIGRKPEEVFRVLGDDVVISDEYVSRTYREVIERCGIPISYGKSHQSEEFGEFAGYNITRATMLRPGQWRKAGITNILSLAEELRTPLRGETTLVLEKAQEVVLFSKGLFDPPPSEWPFFIRVSTQMATKNLEDWTLTRRPVWIFKIMQEYRDQWQAAFPLSLTADLSRDIFNYVTGQTPITFVTDEVHTSKVVFRPLKPYFDDDVVMEFNAISRHLDAYSEVLTIALNAITCVLSLWERDVLGTQDASKLMDEVSEAINSLLWCPPKGHQEVYVVNTIRDLIREVLAASS